jgi:RimJ/RimL family protein N-acetyltransferase/lysophospholipase L1-like esterase
MEIITKRLRLVSISSEFIDDIFVNFTSEITKYMYPKQAANRSETEEFVTSSMKNNADGIENVVVVINKNTSEFLGCMGVHSLNTLNPVLGLWIKKSAHGHGYGIEGMSALIKYAYEHYNFHHLVYDVDKDNYPSWRIAEKNGGVIRREYVKYGASGNRLNLIEYWLYKNPEDIKKIPPIFIFQGDSITDSERDKNYAYGLGNGYVHMVQSRFPGSIVINRGNSGNTIFDMAAILETETIALQPDLASILVGINDILHHYRDGISFTPNTFAAEYRKVLVSIKTALPAAKILIIEPFAFPSGEFKPNWQPDLTKIQIITRLLADKYADFYIPMATVLAEQAKTMAYETILYDGIHPTRLGHQLIANAIINTIGTSY